MTRAGGLHLLARWLASLGATRVDAAADLCPLDRVALSLDEATALRDAWMQAEIAVATGQSYTIGGRTLTRADARYVGQRLAYYDRLVSALQAGRAPGPRFVRVMPRDL